MEGVIVVDHPLVQHKLTLIRDKTRSTKSFRELLSEIGMLICYEVTRDLPLTKVEVETPLATMMSPRIAGKKLVFAPILRAGLTFVEGMLDLVPAARVAHIGLYREPQTFWRRRILLQGTDRSRRAACHRRFAGARDRQYRRRRGRSVEGTRRQADPLRLSDLRAAGHRQSARRPSGCSRFGRRRSTTGSMSTPSSCPVSAMPATAPTARSDCLYIVWRKKQVEHAAVRLPW